MSPQRDSTRIAKIPAQRIAAKIQITGEPACAVRRTPQREFPPPAADRRVPAPGTAPPRRSLSPPQPNPRWARAPHADPRPSISSPEGDLIPVVRASQRSVYRLPAARSNVCSNRKHDSASLSAERDAVTRRRRQMHMRHALRFNRPPVEPVIQRRAPKISIKNSCRRSLSGQLPNLQGPGILFADQAIASLKQLRQIRRVAITRQSPSRLHNRPILSSRPAFG